MIPTVDDERYLLIGEVVDLVDIPAPGIDTFAYGITTLMAAIALLTKKHNGDLGKVLAVINSQLPHCPVEALKARIDEARAVVKGN